MQQLVTSKFLHSRKLLLHYARILCTKEAQSNDGVGFRAEFLIYAHPGKMI